MNFELKENTGFVRVPEGEQIITITSAKAVPSGKPQYIEVEFEHANGGKVKSTYDLAKEMGQIIFSILLRNTIGAIKTFDTDNVGLLVGKSIVAEIAYTKAVNKNDPTKTVTFVNIKRIIGKAETPTTEIEIAEEDDI